VDKVFHPVQPHFDPSDAIAVSKEGIFLPRRLDEVIADFLAKNATIRTNNIEISEIVSERVKHVLLMHIAPAAQDMR
jgi:hypothetical protein